MWLLWLCFAKCNHQPCSPRFSPNLLACVSEASSIPKSSRIIHPSCSPHDTTNPHTGRRTSYFFINRSSSCFPSSLRPRFPVLLLRSNTLLYIIIAYTTQQTDQRACSKHVWAAEKRRRRRWWRQQGQEFRGRTAKGECRGRPGWKRQGGRERG